MDTERFDRQIRLFGREGQARLERARVGIVGLGGLGSHVAQQLALLGSRSIRLIDADTVNESNLNRLVGGSAADFDAARPKVEVAERLILAVTPDADVDTLPESFISKRGVGLIRRCDYVFGCVDSDPARLVLNEVCQAFAIPFIDIATDVPKQKDGPIRFGGRMIFSTGGELCVVCTAVLDSEAVRLGLMNQAQRLEDDAIYGVPRGDVDGTGPAVVSLNGVLASIAVTEFMVEVTGLRPAKRHLEYHGERGIVASDSDVPTQHCYYCKGIYGCQTFDLGPYESLSTF